MANNAQNVTTGKPKASGAMWAAVTGTPLPESVKATLDTAFNNLGYVSEDGVTNSNSPESDDISAWGGDVVYNTQTGKPDTFSFMLIESLNLYVLKSVYGDENVTKSDDGEIKIVANSKELPDQCWVIDMMMRNNVPKRLVIPYGKISAVGDINYKDDEVVGYDVTITASPDTEGNTHYEYIGTAETTNGTDGDTGGDTEPQG